MSEGPRQRKAGLFQSLAIPPKPPYQTGAYTDTLGHQNIVNGAAVQSQSLIFKLLQFSKYPAMGSQNSDTKDKLLAGNSDQGSIRKRLRRLSSSGLEKVSEAVHFAEVKIEKALTVVWDELGELEIQMALGTS